MPLRESIRWAARAHDFEAVVAPYSASPRQSHSGLCNVDLRGGGCDVRKSDPRDCGDREE
jgi:hypothetical protein